MVRKTEPKYIKNILLYEWINLGEPLVILYYPHRSNLIIVPTHCQEFSLEASMYSILSRIFTGSIYSTHCQEFHWTYLCILHTLKKIPWKYLFYTLSRIFMEVSILPTVKNFPGSVYTHCKEFPLVLSTHLQDLPLVEYTVQYTLSRFSPSSIYTMSKISPGRI